ncbi:mRNA interferase HigB [Pseudomonas gessardii]|uniref:Type II toxin-antitoxin system HigB family toxin n=1 Tax=Pseudomonas gessardii TaxID=78544 RepID=A0ABS9EYS2_9PSED|nr:type II toxin-antitoxin system HigB family toxin [Pseudomonas gessardii]MCF4976980.1 type II toxin-antitoxin system HigB family toxin [Pseudomonas gessardii]MCF4987955.1 type II toxin-antitoxin system HigB family toxin [Pseudomonas gessardii]MCF5082960.1 type II toxin-antitoxin system HigB family toxin [Pseudomonas gessardii]MCF5093411.1 type II toxin-antitoxin system HigB family toxin [Pseudomonas gessardii]MCF5105353.1 type II toxin-antitoxin system HigB family toxin [Pseudomonas gessardi
MRVISVRPIRNAKEKWSNSASALDEWYRKVRVITPGDFAALRSVFPSVDKVGSLHVFNIGGNKLRLIAVVRYRMQRLYIRHVLDHHEYDKGRWKE